MKQLNLSIAILFLFISTVAQDLSVRNLTCDHRADPLGIDNIKPRFSWKIYGNGNSIMQTAYSIRVSTDMKFS
ncbi:MAG TPA: hypothetical protein DCP74_05350, partial [Bacteroidales bacterium]|nr:hypothetical protein [Bacteroidales bacterium]